MPNIITAQRTYASVENATKALRDKLNAANLLLEDERWLIAVSPNDGRYVPVLVGVKYIPFSHAGIMVIG